MSQVELRTTVRTAVQITWSFSFPKQFTFPMANAVVKANFHSDAACAPVFVCSFFLWHGW